MRNISMSIIVLSFCLLALRYEVAFAQRLDEYGVYREQEAVHHQVDALVREQHEIRTVLEHGFYRLERLFNDFRLSNERKFIDLQTHVISIEDQLDRLEGRTIRHPQDIPTTAAAPRHGYHDNTMTGNDNFNHIENLLNYDSYAPQRNWYDEQEDSVRTTPAPTLQTLWPLGVATPQPYNHPYQSRDYENIRGSMNDNTGMLQENHNYIDSVQRENHGSDVPRGIPTAPGNKRRGALKRILKGMKKKSALKRKVYYKQKYYGKYTQLENDLYRDEQRRPTEATTTESEGANNYYEPNEHQREMSQTTEYHKNKGHRKPKWSDEDGSASNGVKKRRKTGWIHGAKSAYEYQPKLPDNCPGYVDVISASEPLIHGNSTSVIGTIMKDTGNTTDKRVWVVEGYTTLQWNTIYEYQNESALLNQHPPRTHTLQQQCSGYGSVIHQGHLYCYMHTTDRKHIHLMSYDINQEKKITERRLKSSKVDIDLTSYDGWAGAYVPVQLAIDQSGLWLIAPNKQELLTIYKLDMESLKIIKTYVTEKKKKNIGPGVMICGVWYALNSHNAHYVSYMYNTHTESAQEFHKDILPTPEADLVTLQYNPIDQQVYTWIRIIDYGKAGKTSVHGIAEKYTISWRKL